MIYTYLQAKTHKDNTKKYKTRKEIEKCVNCWLAWQIIIHAVTKKYKWGNK